MSARIRYVINIVPKLGFWNVLYMVWYRISMKLGIRKIWFPVQELPKGTFYKEVSEVASGYSNEWRQPLIKKANDILAGEFTWFSYHTFNINQIPNWTANPFDGSSIPDNTKHWTVISDFNLPIGDVKIVWELSRFDWLTDLARAYKVTGEKKYLNRINESLENWSENNPLNIGVNWKCGQEAGFRIMKLISTAAILDQYIDPTNNLQDLVYAHLKRIYPNINYAIAQNNNHGTTEASALYIGSAWLLSVGYNCSHLNQWKIKGEKLLLGRIKKLIQQQGSFAQRSMTYHRVVVDTFSWVLYNQKSLDIPGWEKSFLDKIEKLGEWQYKMTFGNNGDAPNYGSNDGANIGNLNSLDYRDFRGSTQSLFCILLGCRVYDDNYVDETAYWYINRDINQLPILKIDLPEYELLDNHILILRNSNASVFVKLPDTAFRPGTDAFHLDLWIGGENVLRDNGSYSYNDHTMTTLFMSTAYHNTLRYKEHEQMPKLSRFLNAQWIDCSLSEIIDKTDTLEWKGEYYDYKKCKHQRIVKLTNHTLSIFDSGNEHNPFEVNYHISDEKHLKRFSSENTYLMGYSNYSLYYMEKSLKPLMTYVGNNTIRVNIDLR